VTRAPARRLRGRTLFRYPAERVFSLRDIVWSVLVCVALTGALQLLPAWSAHSQVERDALEGFVQAYAGYRYLSGDVITPRDRGVQVDPLRPPVVRRRLDITAEKINWSGNKVELIAYHMIELADGSPGNADASQEVHVRLERRGSHWVYTLFDVRSGPSLEVLGGGNPWAQALIAAQAQADEQRDDG